MKILNEFDAVRDGTFLEFKSFYSGNVNIMNKYVNLTLLSLSMINDKNEEEKSCAFIKWNCCYPCWCGNIFLYKKWDPC